MAMRTPDNRVISVIEQYREQLGAIYPADEVRSIVRAVFHERLGWDAARVELQKLESLHESDLLKVYLPLKRLRAGEPLQHVLGTVRFHGLSLRVTRDVLIPRPETEELVELIVAAGPEPVRIVDVGTGSGCIALALKKHFAGARVIGIDISEAALVVAVGNGASNGLHVEWHQTDVLKDDFTFLAGTDFVVSNPPYIPLTEEDTIDPHVRDREPHLALFTPADDPLIFYRAIGRAAFAALPNGGHLWFEGHRSYSQAVGDLLRNFGFAHVEVRKDMSANDRFIHAVR